MVNTFTDVMAAMLASITRSGFTEDFSGTLDDWTLSSGTQPTISSEKLKILNAVLTRSVVVPNTSQIDWTLKYHGDVDTGPLCYIMFYNASTPVLQAGAVGGASTITWSLYNYDDAASTYGTMAVDTEYSLALVFDSDAGTVDLQVDGVSVITGVSFSSSWDIMYIRAGVSTPASDYFLVDDIEVTQVLEHAIIQDNEKPKRHTRETYIHVKPAPGTPDLAFDGSYITEDLQGVVEVFAKNDTTRNAIVDDVRTALAAGDYPFMILREGYMDARNYHLYTFNIKLTV